MRSKSRISSASPTSTLRLKGDTTASGALQLSFNNADSPLNMAQVNGFFREQSPIEQPRSASGRVASMSRSVFSSPEQAPQEPTQWSSAIGHASTGKSGRVIERLQGEIDRLNREKHLVKARQDEVEKENETLATRNSYLQDRNSNYEQSHEANSRQLGRKDRQLEEQREELKREKQKTLRAEEQAHVASINEEEWRGQANKAKAVASQRESEYNTVVSCRTMDNDRHQGGLDKIKTSFEALLRQREEDVDKQKKLEIIAEQQRQTIGQLEELTKKLNANFKAYRTEIDKAVRELRENASGTDEAMNRKLAEMQETTGKMKWVMSVDEVINGNAPRPMPAATPQDSQSQRPTRRPQTSESVAESEPRSPKATQERSQSKTRQRLRKITRSGK